MRYGDILPCLPLLLLLTWAAAQDLLEYRIRNWLTLSLVVTGFAQSCTPWGSVTPAASLLGLAMGLAIPFLVFAVGGLGAGDVKLVAGVGAWVGPGPVLIMFVLAAILASILGLGMAVARGRLGTTLRNAFLVLINVLHIRRLGLDQIQETGRQCRQRGGIALPFAIPVWVATVLTLFTPIPSLLAGR